jgi:hypothetical protein
MCGECDTHHKTPVDKENTRREYFSNAIQVLSPVCTTVYSALPGDGLAFASLVDDVLRDVCAPLLDPASALTFALTCKRTYRLLEDYCTASRGRVWLLLLMVEHGHNQQLRWAVEYVDITYDNILGFQLKNAAKAITATNKQPSRSLCKDFVCNDNILALSALHQWHGVLDFLYITDKHEARVTYYDNWNLFVASNGNATTRHVYTFCARLATPEAAYLIVENIITYAKENDASDDTYHLNIIPAFQTLWRTAGRPLNQWIDAVNVAMAREAGSILYFLLRHAPPAFDLANLFGVCQCTLGSMTPTNVAVLHMCGYYHAFVSAALDLTATSLPVEIRAEQTLGDWLCAVFLTVPLPDMDTITAWLCRVLPDKPRRALVRLLSNGTWPCTDAVKLRAVVDDEHVHRALDERARACV